MTRKNCSAISHGIQHGAFRWSWPSGSACGSALTLDRWLGTNTLVLLYLSIDRHRGRFQKHLCHCRQGDPQDDGSDQRRYLFAVIIKGSLGLLAVLTLGGLPVFRQSGSGSAGGRQHRDCKLPLDAKRAAAHTGTVAGQCTALRTDALHRPHDSYRMCPVLRINIRMVLAGWCADRGYPLL